MTQAEKLKKALSSFDEETLASTFSTEELSNIERLLGEPSALTQQRAVEDALGIPTAKAIPETEEMSKLGQGIAGTLAPLLGGTKTGANMFGTGGAIVGGIVGKSPASVEVGRKVGTGLGMITQSAVKAAMGGSVGYLGEVKVRNAVNDAELNASLSEALRAGGEEAMWDVAGNSLVKAGSKLASLIKFKPKEGAKEVQKELEKRGSSLALDQVVDNGVVTFLGELLRGSALTAGPFERLASNQSETVVKYYDDIVSDMAGASRASLENAGVARLVRHALKDGKKLHSEASGVMFDELDKAVQFVAKESESRVIKAEEVVPKGLEDTLTGADLIALQAGRQGAEKVTKFKRPVSLVSVRKEMKDLVKEMKIRGTVDPSGQGVKLITDVGAGAKELSFRDTHELLSELKRLQRDKTFSGPIKVKLPKIIERVQNSFNDAAAQYPGNIEKAYKRARTFSKMGANRFNNKFVKAIIEAENPSAIGKMVAQSAPEEIIRLKKALSLSQTRQGAKGVNLWPKVQGGLLETLLPQNINQLGKSAISTRNVNREVKSRLVATLGTDGYKTLDKGLKLVEGILENQAVRGNFNNRLAGIALTGGIVGTGAVTDTLPTTVVGFILAPKLLARAMTNPKYVKALANLTTKEASLPAKRVALLKILALQDDIAKEVEEAEQE
tara:strand:+ start:1143 stop:3155 length:2013 start_codon:yes stop_codon:yes gene_type:complete